MSTTDPKLSALAAEINKEYLEIQKRDTLISETHKSNLESALRAGAALNEVKDALKHNEFGRWLAVHCKVSDRMARNYMRIANVEAANPGTASAFQGGISAFLNEHADPEIKRNREAREKAKREAEEKAKADEAKVAAALKAATGSSTISGAVPPPPAQVEGNIILTDEEAALLAEDLGEQEPPKAPPAAQPAPQSSIRETLAADLEALKGYGGTCDARLIAAVRAAVRANLIAGKRLTSEAELAARVAKILKHEVSETQVVAAYSEMLELERPSGPLCIFGKEAPRPVSAADRSKAVAKIHSYKERQVAEAKAKRESEAQEGDELIPELDMGKADEAPVKKPTPDGYQIKTAALAASSTALLSVIEGVQNGTMDHREANRIKKEADAVVRKVAADLKKRLDRTDHEVRA